MCLFIFTLITLSIIIRVSRNSLENRQLKINISYTNILFTIYDWLKDSLVYKYFVCVVCGFLLDPITPQK